MNRLITGWIIVGICLVWGVLRTIDLIDPNFVLNFLAIGGFCFGIYLTKIQMKNKIKFI